VVSVEILGKDVVLNYETIGDEMYFLLNVSNPFGYFGLGFSGNMLNTDMVVFQIKEFTSTKLKYIKYKRVVMTDMYSFGN
jgi:hypothetical protein